ncbi:putative FAD dependent oxidoreductase [Pyrenochaeta sp. MPI-SDFR-AT-0127]|nr:putative FAD dependent oxidoreductase [Pyrenochaeta sp. MPI-SDFR-AT-0127]
MASAVLGNPFTSKSPFTGISKACNSLADTYTDSVFFPSSAVYEDIRQDYWSNSSILSPACIFTPASAKEVSAAVKTFRRFNAPFAVRGQGGMPITGYANINSTGALISLNKIKAVSISDDKSMVSIGAGNDWDAVYGFLQPYNLTTVGARLGLVGVSGHVLGGGMTFMSNELGFSSTSVVEYECILADGSIVIATQTSYPDLYWSLKSGGNSFALVTTFRMLTYPTGTIYAGVGTYTGTQRAAWITSVYSQAVHGDADTRGGVEATATWNPAANPDFSYTSYLFYGGDDSTPDVLQNWTGGALLEPTNGANPLQRTTVFDFSRSLYGGVPVNLGSRTRFSVVSVKAVSRDALQLVHDDLFAAARSRLTGLAGISVGLVALPVGRRFVEASKANGGNPMGLDAAEGPFIWCIQTYNWLEAKDDVVIDEFSKTWGEQIAAQLEAKGWKDEFVYLNDADRWQNVFASFGADNLQKMKNIRHQYDPDMVFTRLMPGGWKVAHA